MSNLSISLLQLLLFLSISSTKVFVRGLASYYMENGTDFMDCLQKEFGDIPGTSATSPEEACDDNNSNLNFGSVPVPKRFEKPKKYVSTDDSCAYTIYRKSFSKFHSRCVAILIDRLVVIARLSFR